MELDIYNLATDILGRELDPVYTSDALDFFKGKTVLVTGGGGSIGSEIVRQLLTLNSVNVVCVDRDEYALYRLDLSLHGSALLTDEHLELADITIKSDLDRVFRKWNPDIVFHAAAVKHLTLLERAPYAALHTNVLGSKNVFETAKKYGVTNVVNISTDKAASPTSTLGYSKRLAEIIAASSSDERTTISSVRFGNVFASRGSFIETIEWQVKRGQPITVTDKNATRFFMSIPQAAGLVIESAVFAKSGKTYVLDMAQPVHIVDVVERYLKYIGSDSTNIIYSGLRTGEKMHEIVYDESEISNPTPNDKIRCITSNYPDISDNEIMQLIAASYDTEHTTLTSEEIKDQLKNIINKGEPAWIL